MNGDIRYQLFVFVLCCGFGAVAGLIFDIFRVSRRIICTGAIWTFVEDILFWIIISLMFFLLILKYYNGEFRSFMMIGVLIGALVYLNTLSRIFVQVSVFLLKASVKVCSKFIKFVFWPLVMVLRLLNKPVFLVFNLGKKGLKRLYSKFVFDVTVIKKFFFRRKSL